MRQNPPTFLPFSHPAPRILLPQASQCHHNRLKLHTRPTHSCTSNNKPPQIITLAPEVFPSHSHKQLARTLSSPTILPRRLITSCQSIHRIIIISTNSSRSPSPVVLSLLGRLRSRANTDCNRPLQPTRTTINRTAVASIRQDSSLASKNSTTRPRLWDRYHRTRTASYRGSHSHSPSHSQKTCRREGPRQLPARNNRRQWTPRL